MTTTLTGQPLRERYLKAIKAPEYDDSIPGVKEARAAKSTAESVLYRWNRTLSEANKKRASKAKAEAVAEATEQVEVARMAVEPAATRLDDLTVVPEKERHLELVRIQTEVVQAAFLMGGANYLHKTPEDWGVAILDEPSFEYVEGEHGPVFAIEITQPNGWQKVVRLRIKLSFQRDVRYEVVALTDERDEHNPRLKKEWFTGGQVILRSPRYGDEEELTVSFPSVSYQPLPESLMARAVVNVTCQLAERVQELLLPREGTK